jgi:hypothetical protein
MTESEKWGKLRDAVRMRISQAIAKEEKVTSDDAKMAVRMNMMAYKDVIRLMDLLEKQ